MATVFISHAGQDRELTESVADRLRAVGVGLFVDFDPHDGIPAGADWEQVLYRRIDRADALLLVLTSSVAGSRWCEREVGHARALRRPVLVLRAEADVESTDLAHVQWLELSDPRWPERLRDGLVALGIDPDAPLDWDRGRSPYPGLESFDPADAGVFFARESEIRRLLDHLEQADRPSVLAVVGRSGSGKSSLVHAGLLPRVTDRWCVLPSVEPGTEPVRSLVVSLTQGLAVHGVVRDVATVLREVEASPGRVSGLVDELAGAASPASRRAVLVVVDQAEELQTVADPEQCRRFLDLLRRMAGARARVCVVMTLRSEVADGVLGMPDLVALHQMRLDMEPVPPTRLREVIERPARRADIEFEDGLVEQIVADASGGGDALPLLAHALRRLVDGELGPQRLVTWERYGQIGGVLESLDARARQISQRLAADEYSTDEVVLPTMLRFAELSDQGEPVSRPVAYEGLDDPARAVVDAFVAARLLTRTGGAAGAPPGVTVHVAHEALLRRWTDLEAAIRRAGPALRVHGELARLASDWEREGENESYLLTGDRLTRVETLVARPVLDVPVESPPSESEPVRLDVSRRERRFVEASRTRENDRARRRRRRRALVAGLVVAALLGGTIAVVAGANARSANSAAASRALAAASAGDAARNPAAAAMLALAAYRESPTAEAEQTLFDQYVAKQNLGSVFSGAPGNLRQAQVSRDGRVVVGLTENGLLAIWSRTPSGVIDQRQSSAAAEAEAMGLSPDGTTVWLKRRAGLTRYDVSTGAMQVVGPLAATDVNNSEFAVSADGSTLASLVGSPQSYVVRAWDTTTGRVLADLPVPSALAASSIGFGPGRTVLIGNPLTDRTVVRWTPGDPAPPAVIATGAGASAVTPGSDVAVVCQDQSITEVTDFTVPSPPTVVSAVRVSDGAVLRTLTTSSQSCGQLATDAEGATAGSLSTSQGGVSIGDDSGSYDLAGGRSTTFVSPVDGPRDGQGGSPRVLPSLVPGPGGPQFAVVSVAGVALVPVPSPTRTVSGVIKVGLLGDGATQLAVADDGATLVHATTLESPGRILATASRPAPYWRTGPGDEQSSGSLLADRVATDRVMVRHLPDLAPMAEIPTKPVGPADSAPEDAAVRTLAFDRAGNLMVAVGPDVSVWDPVHVRRLGHVDLAAMGLATPDELVAVRPGRDPSQLVVAAPNQPDVRFVDVASSREVGRLPTGPDVVAATYDPIGRYIALARRGGVLEVWDTRTSARVLGPLPLLPPGPVLDPTTAALATGFVDEAGTVMIASGSRVRVYGVGSPTPLRTLDVGAGQQVNGLSAHGEVMITQRISGSGSTLSLRPGDWQTDICRVIGGRSFTDAERNAAPAPLPAGPLCP